MATRNKDTRQAEKVDSLEIIDMQDFWPDLVSQWISKMRIKSIRFQGWITWVSLQSAEGEVLGRTLEWQCPDGIRIGAWSLRDGQKAKRQARGVGQAPSDTVHYREVVEGRNPNASSE